jgi:hypothetical protein
MTASVGGNDTLSGIVGAIPQNTNLFFGDARIMTSSLGGRDTLTGVSGGSRVTNQLYGDAETMVSSKGGNDTVTGGANARTNTLQGDAHAMTASSRGGNDTLTGASSLLGNTLVGDASFGGDGVTGGDDRLVSAVNTSDQMWGDFQEGTATGGDDTFVLNFGNGTDFIHDFRKGEDRIELDGISELLPFEALNIKTVDTNNDGVADSSLINFGDSNSVTVYNVTNLTAGDILIYA